MKTANAVNPRRAKFEIVISAAMVSALASLTTAETIDISSICKGIDGGGLSRAVNKEHVVGDPEPIIDYDDKLEQGAFTLTFLYTNGKDTIGTDGLDIAALFKELVEYNTSPLPVQFIWSLAGGNVGDEERITDPNNTFITHVSDPVGGVDTNGKVQMQVTFDTQKVTVATVS